MVRLLSAPGGRSQLQVNDAASAALSCSASALFTFAKHVVAFPILGCAGSLGALSAVDASGSLYVLCPIVTLCWRLGM